MLEDKFHRGGWTDRGSMADKQPDRRFPSQRKDVAETVAGAGSNGEVDVAPLLAAAEERDRLAEARDTAANNREIFIWFVFLQTNLGLPSGPEDDKTFKLYGLILDEYLARNSASLGVMTLWL